MSTVNSKAYDVEGHFIAGDTVKLKYDDSKGNFQQIEHLTPIVRDSRKIGRNEPCPCGSGKKFKRCHGG